MKALVFDLDDTLYNEADFVSGAFGAVAEYLSEKYSISCKELKDTMLKLLTEEGRGRIFDRLCDIYRLSETVDKLVEIYRSAAPQISLYGDAEYFLKHSKGRYKLGLITDGLYSVQRNKIRLLGIESFFDAIIVTDEYGKDFWKPSIKPYARMAEELGVGFGEMIYIGDNPRKDFIGARQLGIKTIRIVRHMGDHMSVRLERDYEADTEISDMYELEVSINKLQEMR